MDGVQRQPGGRVFIAGMTLLTGGLLDSCFVLDVRRGSSSAFRERAAGSCRQLI